MYIMEESLARRRAPVGQAHAAFSKFLLFLDTVFNTLVNKHGTAPLFSYFTAIIVIHYCKTLQVLFY